MRDRLQATDEKLRRLFAMLEQAPAPPSHFLPFRPFIPSLDARVDPHSSIPPARHACPSLAALCLVAVDGSGPDIGALRSMAYDGMPWAVLGATTMRMACYA